MASMVHDWTAKEAQKREVRGLLHGTATVLLLLWYVLCIMSLKLTRLESSKSSNRRIPGGCDKPPSLGERILI